MSKTIEDYLRPKKVRPLQVRVTYHAYERFKERTNYTGSITSLIEELNTHESTIWRMGKKLFSNRMACSFIIKKAMSGGYLCITTYPEVIILNESAQKVSVHWSLCTELENEACTHE